MESRYDVTAAAVLALLRFADEREAMESTYDVIPAAPTAEG